MSINAVAVNFGSTGYAIGKRDSAIFAQREIIMRKLQSIIALAGVSLLVGSLSTAAMAQSRSTRAAASRDVSQLVRLMDKDQNGTVSKQEFLDFMSQTYDQLDINKTGELGPREVGQLRAWDWDMNRPRGQLPRDRLANPPRGNPNRIPQNATTQPF